MLESADIFRFIINKIKLGQVKLKVVLYRDGIRQSNINTKVFEVDYVQPQVTWNPQDDDKAFQKDLISQKNQVCVLEFK